MPYLTDYKVPKADSTSLFFLFVILGLIILLLVVSMVGDGFWGESFMPAPSVLATNEAQNPLYESFPVALTIPVARVEAVVVPSAVHAVAEAHLKIPRIGVDTAIKDMGVTSEGAMAVPSNRTDVGWYSLGTRPGETGSAVIGGHNVWDSGAGVFADLDQLERGDVLSVVDVKGVSISFIVRDMRTYDATDTNTGIFESKSGIHLNLITCSGEFDPSTKSYTERLVIFTDIVKGANKVSIL